MFAFVLHKQLICWSVASEVDSHAAQLATLLKNFELLKKSNQTMGDSPAVGIGHTDEDDDDDVFGSIVAQMKQLKGSFVFFLVTFANHVTSICSASGISSG
jgi:hypothetical protein